MRLHTTMTLAAGLAALAIGVRFDAVQADAAVRDLRIRPSGSTSMLTSPARLVGTVRAVDLLFESKGAAETVRLTVRAPGGLVVLTQDVGIASETWQRQTVTLRGERVCTAVTGGMREAWSGLRSDADRLVKARAGHQEFLLQVQSRAVTLRSQQSLLSRLSWNAAATADLATLERQLQATESLVAKARELEPSAVEALKSLAQDMVALADQAIPIALTMTTNGACGPETFLPPSGPGTYDIALSQGGFPALSGEFRIDPAPRIYLPALAHP
ncbi:MAG: hypothetical protein IPJ58_04630 [Ardenticatenia bacterium]|nr:hypothetical protein [Ardenticatenia bacterium]